MASLVIGRRGFLQSIIGVPLAVKVFVSPLPARLSHTVLTTALGWNSHDWFDFTVSAYKPVDRWQSWNDPGVLHVTPIGPTEYTIKASCYGHHDDLKEAMLEDHQVVVHLPKFGQLQVRIDSISENASLDGLTTDIEGTITKMVAA